MVRAGEGEGEGGRAVVSLRAAGVVMWSHGGVFTEGWRGKEEGGRDGEVVRDWNCRVCTYIQRENTFHPTSLPSSSPLTITSRIPHKVQRARSQACLRIHTNKTNPIHPRFPFFHPDFRGVSGVSGVSGACEDFGGRGC